MTTLTGTDPEPPYGTTVSDARGGRWMNENHGSAAGWVRLSGRDDPATWGGLTGGYGPVTVLEWGDGA